MPGHNCHIPSQVVTNCHTSSELKWAWHASSDVLKPQLSLELWANMSQAQLGQAEPGHGHGLVMALAQLGDSESLSQAIKPWLTRKYFSFWANEQLVICN